MPVTIRRSAQNSNVYGVYGIMSSDNLDQTLFWNQSDLERKLENYKPITTTAGVTARWPELRRLKRNGIPHRQSQKLESYSWRQHCNGLFQTPTAA
jgi:hypothetical protein